MDKESNKVIVQRNETTRLLALKLEAYDKSTFDHSVEVACLSYSIAKTLGYAESECEELIICGLVHDIGKIQIPIEIIKKPSKLSSAETKIMQTHCLLGFDIAKNIGLSEKISKTALYHHERMDGSGYLSLKNHQIPLEAKIIAIADVYCAMIENRPYRKGFEENYVRSHILSRPEQFDLNIFSQNMSI